MDANLYNGLALAYIGDAIYELEIRKYALEKGFTKAKKMHEFVNIYVCANGQSKIINYLINNNILEQSEYSIYLRGRNTKINTYHKNLELSTYKEATGFEALIGYLYLNNSFNRLNLIFDIIKKGNLL